MKRLYLATTALAVIGCMAPASAADSTADLARQIQVLQEQLRSVQQQLDLLKASPAVAAAPPAAPAVSPPAAPKVTQSATNRFALSSADGQNTIALTGRLHLDLGHYAGFKPDSQAVGVGHASTGYLSSGFNARRARIGVTGKVMGDWTYTFIYDAGNSQDLTPAGIQQAQIAYTGFKDTMIEAGYSDTPFTLDQAISSNDTMFMERASPGVVATSINAGDFRSNIGVRTWGPRYWIGAYLTGPASGNAHALTAETFGAFQRATYQLVQEKNASVHVGVGVSELIKSPNTGPGTAHSITLSERPELRIDPTAFLNTGALGTLASPVTGATVLNAETAASYGNFFYQGEYFHYVVNRRGRTKANFDGAYGQVSYTFGGHRNYTPNTGGYSGVIPDRPFTSSLAGGLGALELAARVSYITLVDNFVSGTALAAQPDAVNGGRQTNFTVGANWYLNSNIRLMLNYVHGRYKKANSTAVAGAALGVPVGMELDAIALRWQVAF